MLSHIIDISSFEKWTFKICNDLFTTPYYINPGLVSCPSHTLVSYLWQLILYVFAVFWKKRLQFGAGSDHGWLCCKFALFTACKAGRSLCCVVLKLQCLVCCFCSHSYSPTINDKMAFRKIVATIDYSKFLDLSRKWCAKSDSFTINLDRRRHLSRYTK